MVSVMINLNELAASSDKAICNGEESEIRTIVTLLEQKLTHENGAVAKCYAHYLLGNLRTKLALIAGESAAGWRQGTYPTNLTAGINHLRQAKALISNKTEVIRGEIQTNLANALACQRRNIEVLEDWNSDFSLKGDAPFVSALAKARELIWISRWLSDNGHAKLYQYEAYLLLKELEANLTNTDHSAVINALQNDAVIIKLIKSEESFKPLSGWSKQYSADSYGDDEKEYRAWCLDNRLFANPINNISKEWIADKDVLQFPNHVVSIGDGPYFAAAFSSLKREYCFARHMAFEGIHEIHPKYENEQLFLVNTLDYVHYSGAVEKTKTAFRICFSVLDSLAALMSAYFQCKAEQAAYKPNWIRDNFKDKAENPFVDALYWLSCDLLDDEKTVSDPNKWKAPNPSSSEIRRIRNAIEHGWLRVAEQKQTIWEKDNDFAYVLSPEDLQKQTLFLLKIVRAAMHYLCMAVTYNEKSKKTEEKVIMPNPLPMIDDEFISLY